MLLEELDGLAVQRHLHLTPFLPLLQENSFYGCMHSGIGLGTRAVMPLQCLLLLRLDDALPDQSPKIVGVYSTFEHRCHHIKFSMKLLHETLQIRM
jgi:hypothetical protein